MTTTDRMNPLHSQLYDLGRQARKADFKTSVCNMGDANPNRAWWIAGWHDEDYEQGVRVYAPEKV
jgi:hypothetical protein